MSVRRIVVLGGIIVATLAVVIASTVIIVMSYNKKDTPPGVEGAQASLELTAKQASFKSYIPGQLPSGFSVSASDSSYSKGVLSYKVTTPSNKEITVTQQQKPSEVTNNMFSGERVTTNLGKATVALTPTGTSAAIVTNTDTLIILNSSQQVQKSEILTLLGVLQ